MFEFQEDHASFRIFDETDRHGEYQAICPAGTCFEVTSTSVVGSGQGPFWLVKLRQIAPVATAAMRDFHGSHVNYDDVMWA